MKKQTYKNYPNPILWFANARPLTFNSNYILPANGILKAGSIIELDEEKILKSGKTYEAGTGTEIKVFKDHSFGIGDSFYYLSSNANIVSIDSTNEDYDTITLDASLTVTGNMVVYSTESGNPINATGDSFAVILDTITFETGDTVTVNVSDNVLIDNDKQPDYSKRFINQNMIKIVYTNQ